MVRLAEAPSELNARLRGGDADKPDIDPPVLRSSAPVHPSRGTLLGDLLISSTRFLEQLTMTGCAPRRVEKESAL